MKSFKTIKRKFKHLSWLEKAYFNVLERARVHELRNGSLKKKYERRTDIKFIDYLNKRDENIEKSKLYYDTARMMKDEIQFKVDQIMNMINRGQKYVVLKREDLENLKQREYKFPIYGESPIFTFSNKQKEKSIESSMNSIFND